MFDLTGRIALVTGAGQGVGAGIALALAGGGAAVAVNDLHQARAVTTVGSIAAAGGRAAAVPFDVSDHDAVTAGFEEAARLLGPVDILVNNAGIPAAGFPQIPFKDTEPAFWRRFVDLNLYGMFNCTHVAVGSMCERGWGRIITISSEAARMGLDINVAIYGASKAGAIGLTRHLAVEVAPAGVTVNAISLGTMENVGGRWGDRIAAGIPRRRLGTGADAGAAVTFLASDEADWVTGQVLPVNGGSRA
ncbi:SDR family NAD(P)-dependent oxidoreductase [Frankia gtarii]|uniref:SDR family NAD(P)-dependent oxidoreductase n=1 Tax=Frankia gtarii TaxID=2950102 RepID=UPI0021C202B4|nr:SDR family NAD(P)-dependent oxidoreductase [Frankia gtarii]